MATATAPAPAETANPDALCQWGHVELGRLTKLATQLGHYGQRWRARAQSCYRRAAEYEQAGNPVAAAEQYTAGAVMEDMLGELAEIMGRPGRRGPHADHLLAAQWHLNQFVAVTRQGRPG
jgi:hypothetical protein